MTRILHYFWADPNDPAKRGGGVRLYLAALTAAQRQAGHDVATLSSGLSHSLRRSAPYWVKCRAGHYAIVNSATLAPSHADFATPAQISDAATEAAFAAFLRDNGPFDVIHFHGFEGLPAQVLQVCGLFPNMRVVLSLHNYHPFCPQVNLWHREMAHCADFQGGAKCATCLPAVPNPRAVRMAYAVESLCARVGLGAGTATHRHLILPAMRAGWKLIKRLRKTAPQPAAPAMPPSPQRRDDFLRLINRHCDVTLAVSDRTGQIARGFGLRNVETCRISTAQAEKWPQTAPRRPDTQTLRLAYLGYMRRDKGFEFLLDALRALPATHAANLHLTVAAQRGAPEVMQKLETLRPKLAGLTWHDGYNHGQLDQILDKADFGLVPVLWEDNLPQTALEMHARHIPLITSDRGGAQELSGDARLVFRAGDTADFARALTHARRGFDPQRYWAKAPPPMDMESHLRALDQFYAGKNISDDRGAA